MKFFKNAHKWGAVFSFIAMIGGLAYIVSFDNIEQFKNFLGSPGEFYLYMFTLFAVPNLIGLSLWYLYRKTTRISVSQYDDIYSFLMRYPELRESIKNVSSISISEYHKIKRKYNGLNIQASVRESLIEKIKRHDEQFPNLYIDSEIGQLFSLTMNELKAMSKRADKYITQTQKELEEERFRNVIAQIKEIQGG